LHKLIYKISTGTYSRPATTGQGWPVFLTLTCLFTAARLLKMRV
jgi:hypothetical protein